MSQNKLCRFLQMAEQVLLTLMDHVHNPVLIDIAKVKLAISTLAVSRENRIQLQPVSAPIENTYQEWLNKRADLKSRWKQTKAMADLRALLQLQMPLP